MESEVAADDAFVGNLANFMIDHPYLVNLILYLFIPVVSLYFLLIAYQKIRRKFHVKVNCWFCCTDTKVPYDLHNNWDCPHCQQYNGFNKDGSYNKVIKEQHNPKLNGRVLYNQFRNTDVDKKEKERSNGFCKLCNINQQLKVQQLALFVPINEKNYDEEVEEYRQKLEKAYKLCSKCETVVKGTLKRQQYCFLTNENVNGTNHKRNNFTLEKDKSHCDKKLENVLLKVQRYSLITMRWTLLFSSVLLCVTLTVQWETEMKLLRAALPPFTYLETLETLFLMASPFLKMIYGFRKAISLAGFLQSLIVNFKQQTKNEQISLVLWGLLHVTCWFEVTGLQTLLCGFLVYFNERSIFSKKIFVQRKQPFRKFSFQPEANFTCAKLNFSTPENTRDDSSSSAWENEKVFSPAHSLENVENSSHSSAEQNLSQGDDGKKRSKQKENEMDSPGEGQKIPELKSSVFRKSFLSALEVGHNERETSPGLEDMYSHLSGLSLGKKQQCGVGASGKKPSNFLFENHNFSSDRKSNPLASPIIKPAKFIKNASNSWTCAELNESISRSSTPSSGYSSQKPSTFDFAKSVSPITANAYPRRDYFDYYDGNARYYNFRCYPHEFMPFQPYSPSPMSHATVYTYTRPTAGLPFGFPGSPGLDNYNKYSPSPSSARISDASDCDSLFRDASKSLENDKKWYRLKTISYHLSISLNCLTLVCFIYLLSAGIISVDWNLPKINFFI